ncbi:hypothetical protein ACRAWF_37765 [Streptomyces sp. L7]
MDVKTKAREVGKQLGAAGLWSRRQIVGETVLALVLGLFAMLSFADESVPRMIAAAVTAVVLSLLRRSFPATVLVLTGAIAGALGTFGVVLMAASWSAGSTDRGAATGARAVRDHLRPLLGTVRQPGATRLSGGADAGVHPARVPGDDGRTRSHQPLPRPATQAGASLARAQRPAAARTRDHRLPRPPARAAAHRPGHARQPRPPTGADRRPHGRPGVWTGT